MRHWTHRSAACIVHDCSQVQDMNRLQRGTRVGRDFRTLNHNRVRVVVDLPAFLKNRKLFQTAGITKVHQRVRLPCLGESFAAQAEQFWGPW